MINLMPRERKESISYARRNKVLVNWVIAMFIGILGIGVVVAGGYYYIDMQTKQYQQSVQQTRERLGAQKLEETQKRLEEISASSKLALQVLSRQILFSEVLQQVATVTPRGAVLQNLTVGKLEGGIDLQFIATDYQTATQAHVNLQDPNNKIFEKADLISITCAPPSTTPDATANPYPCQTSIRALFTKNNPFLFINKGARP
jgi:hypothetical protein